MAFKKAITPGSYLIVWTGTCTGTSPAPHRSLYRFLRQKVQRPQMPETGDFPMPAGWRELIIGEETMT